MTRIAGRGLRVKLMATEIRAAMRQWRWKTRWHDGEDRSECRAAAEITVVGADCGGPGNQPINCRGNRHRGQCGMAKGRDARPVAGARRATAAAWAIGSGGGAARRPWCASYPG